MKHLTDTELEALAKAYPPPTQNPGFADPCKRSPHEELIARLVAEVLDLRVEQCRFIQAIAYIRERRGSISLGTKGDWVASCFRSKHPRSPCLVSHGATPWEAVEKLKKRMP